MPKSFRVVVALVACLALAACGSSRAGGEVEDDRPLVLTTFTVLADIARQVAGEHLRVESVTRPGVEIHGYEPTPGDLRRAEGAALVLDNGLGLEAWFERFVERVDAPHVVVSSRVRPLTISGGDQAGAVNPHAWMSPVEVRGYVDVIADAFSDLAPEHAEDFARNARAYQAELDALHEELLDALETLPVDQRVLVTCEGAFSYLARDAGLEEAYLWAVNAEQQGTPQQTARLVDLVRERDVPAVFCESTVSDSAMRQVADATGARLAGTLYVDSLSEPDGPVPTYLELLRHDVTTIVAGLTGQVGGGAS